MRYLAWLLPLLILPLAPNLLWLATSTLRIQNDTAASVAGLAYGACGQRHELGSLGAGEFVFILLGSCGDDSLDVAIGSDEFCQLYVEGELYHIDATITHSYRVDCGYADPLSALWVQKAWW